MRGERETRRDAFGRAVERPHGRTPGGLAAWAISELTRAATVTVALWELYRVWHERPVSWTLLGAAAVAFVALTLLPDWRPDHEHPVLATQRPGAVTCGAGGLAAGVSIAVGLLHGEPGAVHAGIVTAGVVSAAVGPLVGVPPDEPEPEDESRGGGSWLPEDEAWPKDDRPWDLDRGREIERPMLPPRF